MSGQVTKSSGLENDTSKSRTQERMRQALVGKTSESLIEMHLGLHSLLAQQISEQKKLRAEYEHLKLELKSVKSENAKLQRDLDEQAKNPKHQICDACSKQKKTNTVGRALITGLPPVVNQPTISLKFPGKAPSRIPPFETPKKQQKPQVVVPKVNIFAGIKKAAQSKKKTNKITLFWPQTDGSPSRVDQIDSLPDNKLLKSDKQESKENNVTIPLHLSGVSNFNLSGCIFDHTSSGKNVLDSIKKDPRLEEWFTKQPKKSSEKKPVGKTVSAKRPTCLSVSASQKYHITIRCFKKEFEGEGGWSKFKQNILQCNLTKSQISLLLETVPDKDSPEHHRRWLEWEEAVSRVTKLKTENVEEPLYEDEEFVYYLSTIPDLYKRLGCMLIMASFDELVNRITEFIYVLLDALEVLVANKNIPSLFQVILHLGNYLNENTHLGNKTWFKMAALQKASSLRGYTAGSKSLLYLIANYMLEVLDKKEMGFLEKASKITLVSVVNQIKQVEDIFEILSHESEAAEHIMKRRRRNSILPGLSDSNDKFSEAGKAFVQREASRYSELQQNFEQLLKEYKLAVLYFGDYSAFIPIDRRIEDERNPGQQRFIPDLFTVMYDFLKEYEKALDTIRADQLKEKTIKRTQSMLTQKKSKLEPSASSLSPIKTIQTSIARSSDHLLEESSQTDISQDKSAQPSDPFTSIDDECMSINAQVEKENVPSEDLPPKLSDLCPISKVKSPENPLSFEAGLRKIQNQSRTSILSAFPSTVKINDMMEAPIDLSQADAKMKRRRESLKAVTGYLSLLNRPTTFNPNDSKYDKIYQRLKTDQLRRPQITQKFDVLNSFQKYFGQTTSKLATLEEED